MAIAINYKNGLLKKEVSNLVLFVDEKYNVARLKKHISNSEYLFISDLIKSKDQKKKYLFFDLNSKKRIILVAINDNLKNSEIEKLGAKFFDLIKDSRQSEYIINSESMSKKLNNGVGCFLHGLKLKSYSFDKYKTKKIKKYFINCNWKKTTYFRRTKKV